LGRAVRIRKAEKVRVIDSESRNAEEGRREGGMWSGSREATPVGEGGVRDSYGFKKTPDSTRKSLSMSKSERRPRSPDHGGDNGLRVAKDRRVSQGGGASKQGDERPRSEKYRSARQGRGKRKKVASKRKETQVATIKEKLDKLGPVGNGKGGQP